VIETPLLRAEAITIETLMTELGQSENQIKTLKWAIAQLNASISEGWATAAR